MLENSPADATHTGCQPESLVVMSCFRWLLDIIPRSLPFLPHPLSARAQLRLPPDRPLDHPQSRLVTLNTASRLHSARQLLAIRFYVDRAVGRPAVAARRAGNRARCSDAIRFVAERTSDRARSHGRNLANLREHSSGMLPCRGPAIPLILRRKMKIFAREFLNSPSVPATQSAPAFAIIALCCLPY